VIFSHILECKLKRSLSTKNKNKEKKRRERPEMGENEKRRAGEAEVGGRLAVVIRIR
jgi:hypothetical protein